MPELLSETQVSNALEQLTAWKQEGNTLTRTIRFDSFPQAIQAVTRIAEIAENENHHPDIDIRWRKVTFSCTTHSEGGITANDVSMAREIDAVAEAFLE